MDCLLKKQIQILNEIDKGASPRNDKLQAINELIAELRLTTSLSEVKSTIERASKDLTLTKRRGLFGNLTGESSVLKALTQTKHFINAYDNSIKYAAANNEHTSKLRM